VAVRSKVSGRQTATLEVWGRAGDVIRHQPRRRQRTKTTRLVRRHFNAHICSSTNFGSQNFLSRNFFLEPENFFQDLSRSRLVNIPNADYSYRCSQCLSVSLSVARQWCVQCKPRAMCMVHSVQPSPNVWPLVHCVVSPGCR